MKEASKTMALRDPAQRRLLTTGRTLDIGAGDDPYWPGTECFDRSHGDANRVLRYFAPESFDCVHSSHCLEHMLSPQHTLLDWWKLVRPGGRMNILVPDEELYEQRLWPSRFNDDHKWAFTLNPKRRGAHILQMLDLAMSLPNATIEELRLQDNNYDYSLLPLFSIRPNRLTDKLRRHLKAAHLTHWPNRTVDRCLVRLGALVDQTAEYDALAQISLIAKKGAR